MWFIDVDNTLGTSIMVSSFFLTFFLLTSFFLMVELVVELVEQNSFDVCVQMCMHSCLLFLFCTINNHKNFFLTHQLFNLKIFKWIICIIQLRSI